MLSSLGCDTKRQCSGHNFQLPTKAGGSCSSWASVAERDIQPITCIQTGLSVRRRSVDCASEPTASRAGTRRQSRSVQTCRQMTVLQIGATSSRRLLLCGRSTCSPPGRPYGRMHGNDVDKTTYIVQMGRTDGHGSSWPDGSVSKETTNRPPGGWHAPTFKEYLLQERLQGRIRSSSCGGQWRHWRAGNRSDMAMAARLVHVTHAKPRRQSQP